MHSENAGFVWNSHQTVWEDRWHELLEYKKKHGNCVVPSNYKANPQLALWVKRQRRSVYEFGLQALPWFCTLVAFSFLPSESHRLRDVDLNFGGIFHS